MTKYRGKYPRNINTSYMSKGTSYKLHIITNDGELWHILSCKPGSRLPKLGDDLTKYCDEIDADLRCGRYNT